MVGCVVWWCAWIVWATRRSCVLPTLALSLALVPMDGTGNERMETMNTTTISKVGTIREVLGGWVSRYADGGHRRFATRWDAVCDLMSHAAALNA